MPYLHCVAFCCLLQMWVDIVDNKVTNFIHNISKSCLEFLMPKKWFQSHGVHVALLLCSPFERRPQPLTADNIIKEFRCTPHVLQVPKQDKKAVRVSRTLNLDLPSLCTTRLIASFCCIQLYVGLQLLIVHKAHVVQIKMCTFALS